MRRRIPRIGLAVGLVMTLVLSVPIEAFACTQFYLGSDTTESGSTLVGRSEDVSAQYAKVYTVSQAADHRQGDKMVFIDGFEYPYPEHTLRYTLAKDSFANEGIAPEPYGEVGVNENGVAVSATVTLNRALTPINTADPAVPVRNGGIAETHTTSVVLMQAQTARHGVEVLADAYDTYGSSDREGTTISDANETWFVNVLSGHQYVAVKLPADKIALSPNMTMLTKVDITDTENVIASPGLISTAVNAGTFVAGDGDDPSSPNAVDGHTVINTAASYASKPTSVSTRLHQGYYYLKGVEAANALSADYTEYLTDPRDGGGYTLYEAMRLLAYHGNPDDADHGKYTKRPTGNGVAISNPGMVEAHVFETRSDMPAPLATIEWLALGPAEFSIYIPGYGAAITETEEHFAHDAKVRTPSTEADENKDKSASQVFRQVFALINESDTARDVLEPIVDPIIEQYQKTLIDQQASVDEAMIALYQTDPDQIEKMATELNKSLCAQAYEFGFSLLTDLRALKAAGYQPDSALSEATVELANAVSYSLPYQPLSVEFSATQRSGISTSADSLGIDITFNTPVEGLSIDDITITNATGAVVIGSLSGSGTEWFLSFDSVSAEGDVTIEISDWGLYGVSTAAQNVAVYKLSTERTTTEIAGITRIETAVRNAHLAYPDGADTVIVATAFNFPDALSASSLAGALDAPILLTNPTTLSEPTIYAIGQLNATNIIIIGSEKAVSQDIENKLAALTNSKPLRLAGSDRIATQEAVFNYGLEKGYWSGGDIIVATGMNFPDALSISSYAAAKTMPLFLIGADNELSDRQLALIKAYSAPQDKAIIVGSEKVVSASTAATLSANNLSVVRLAGGVNNSYTDSRYGTSAAIAEFCIDEGFAVNKLAFATGLNFPDALVAGPTQAKIGSFVVLADTIDNIEFLDAAQAVYAKSPGGCYELRYLGSTKALAAEVRNAIQGVIWK